MKYLRVSWTFLDTIEVPDDITPDEVEDLLDEKAPAIWWNDRDWSLEENW